MAQKPSNPPTPLFLAARWAKWVLPYTTLTPPRLVRRNNFFFRCLAILKDALDEASYRRTLKLPTSLLHLAPGSSQLGRAMLTRLLSRVLGVNRFARLLWQQRALVEGRKTVPVSS